MRYLADLDGSHFTGVSSVIERDTGIFFGTLNGDWIGFLPHERLPPVASGTVETS